jgi:hypothetical protein
MTYYEIDKWYVAICNKPNFDGHYIKIFYFPTVGGTVMDGQTWGHVGEHYKKHKNLTISAAWFFLNRVDYGACLEGVYPLSIFDPDKIPFIKNFLRTKA